MELKSLFFLFSLNMIITCGFNLHNPGNKTLNNENYFKFKHVCKGGLLYEIGVKISYQYLLGSKWVNNLIAGFSAKNNDKLLSGSYGFDNFKIKTRQSASFVLIKCRKPDFAS